MKTPAPLSRGLGGGRGGVVRSHCWGRTERHSVRQHPTKRGEALRVPLLANSISYERVAPCYPRAHASNPPGLGGHRGRSAVRLRWPFRGSLGDYFMWVSCGFAGGRKGARLLDPVPHHGPCGDHSTDGDHNSERNGEDRDPEGVAV